MSITIQIFAMLDNAPKPFLLALHQAVSVLAPHFDYNDTRFYVRYDDRFGDTEARPYVRVKGWHAPLPRLFSVELRAAEVVAYCADPDVLAGVETGRYGGAPSSGCSVVGIVDLNLATGSLRATATGVNYEEVKSFFRNMVTSSVSVTMKV